MKKLPRLILFLGGLGLAGWLVFHHAGASGEALRRAGPGGFLLYLAASAPTHALSTWAWRLGFTRGQPETAFTRLFMIRLAGEAANKVTPMASLGGEPVKAYLLARDGAPMRDAITSVAIAKNVMVLAQIAFMFLGIGLACSLRPDRARVLLALGSFPLFVLSGILVTVFLDLRLRRLRKHEAVLETGPPPAPGAWGKARAGIRAMAEVWGRVIDFFWDSPRAFLLCLLFFFLAAVGGALETWTGCRLLGFPVSPLEALTLEALLMAVNFSTFFIPANAGSQEGGFALLTPVVGLVSSQGVALAVLRRCRDLLWVGLGLAYLALREGRVLFEPAAPEGPSAD